MSVDPRTVRQHLEEIQQLSKTIYTAIDEERTRAHRKHAASGQSMEQVDVDHPLRFPILVEEVGEVAKALNEGASREELRAELIQVAAMAAAWAEAITREADARRTDVRR